MFTAIADGADTVAALTRHLNVPPRGLRILCDYLVVMGLLTKAGDRYGLAADSGFFLNRKSPGYMGSAVEFLLSPTQMEPFLDLASAVRNGGGVRGQGVTAPDHPVWVNFARSMAPLMAFPAELLANLLTSDGKPVSKVLDIAAGHGLYGIAVGRRGPATEVYAVDWPNVLEVASENARQANLGSRFHRVPGSAFEVDFGSGFDVTLIVNFLHHFDEETLGKFLRKVHGALQPGGRVVILEFVPNEDRVSPPVAAGFSMMMLPTTPHGDAYTFSDYQRMLAGQGFVSAGLHELAPTYFRAVIATKP